MIDFGRSAATPAAADGRPSPLEEGQQNVDYLLPGNPVMIYKAKTHRFGWVLAPLAIYASPGPLRTLRVGFARDA